VFLEPAAVTSVVLDFNSGEDKLEVSASGFGGGLTAGSAPEVVNGEGVPAATAATGQFLFDTTTSTLYWDADGTDPLAPVAIAQISGVGALSSDDFIVGV
jgi:hypothetical protein